ncbi:MAG TPA: hypothetical protein VEA40_07495 [Ramlibacter sp.]|nr:hypothetical protein [Ramlibacter sp.]
MSEQLYTAAHQLERQLTQAEFAQLIGVSDAKVSQLLNEGVIAEGDTGLAWLRSYLHRLREQAAGRDNALTQARAALAGEQRLNMALKNASLLKTWAPIGMLSEVLANASQSVADRFDALPGEIKKLHPDLTDEHLASFERLLAKARNEWVGQTVTAKLLGQPGDDVAAEDDEPLPDPVRAD